MIDIEASIDTLRINAHDNNGMLKLDTDLYRYTKIISQTNPEVIVETGTHTGASARWFANHGVDVITVDIKLMFDGTTLYSEPPITGFFGKSSTDPETVESIKSLINGRRCMVSLDSDHSTEHVVREIELYGDMVTSGCHLVVEDGIFHYTPQDVRNTHFPDGLIGSPIEAIEYKLIGNPMWIADYETENMYLTTHHPCGWWIKV